MAKRKGEGNMKCKVCEDETKQVVNINFNAVAICERCCLVITKQTVVEWSIKKENS